MSGAEGFGMTRCTTFIWALSGAHRLMANLLYGSGLRFHGMSAPVDQRCRLRTATDHCAGRERHEGSHHDAATQLLEPLQDHIDVTTTVIYTHVLNRGGRGVHSLLDDLGLSS